MTEQNNWNDPQLSDGDFPQVNKTKFQVGDKGIKVKGYKFPCTIVSVFKTVEGNVRVVGEMDKYGLLHIFNEDQLEKSMKFIKYILLWISSNLSIPFWMVGHVHLTMNVYQDIQEIIASFIMNILVGVGFYISWIDYKKENK